jgi:hypothetical protein
VHFLKPEGMSSDDAEQADYRRRAEQQKHSASGGIKLTDEHLISLQRRYLCFHCKIRF